MSKAFTRESDDEQERSLPLRQPSVLPPGAKNYLTPNGAKRLRDELDRLVEVDRPRVAAAQDQKEVKRQLEEIDLRIRHLHQSLQSAVVAVPPAKPWEQVRFGATVTVRNSGGAESRYRIVGLDETDLERDWVSWLSPIAKALLNARLGQKVRFKFPSGEEELEIVAIEYESGISGA
jgi:transcription elongation factor GreB